MNEDSNWLLSYKYNGTVPSEFAELLAYDDTLFQRSGNAKTWGELRETKQAGSEEMPTGTDPPYSPTREDSPLAAH